MVERIAGVLRLDAKTFEEVENDQGATIQALIVVVAVAIASGIGLLLDDTDEAGAGLLGGALGSIVGWAIFAALIAFVGTRLLETAATSSNWAEIARVTGFAQAPNVLGILVFIPILGALAGFVGAIWSLIASVIGIRQALEVSTGRAIAVVVVAWLVGLVVAIIIAAIFGISVAVT